MLKIISFFIFVFCVHIGFAQKQVVVTGTIKNFYPTNYSGKLGFPFYYYNPKSEQHENFTPLFQTTDSFSFRFDLEHPKLFKVFLQPVSLVPGDSVHLDYLHVDEKGDLVSTFTSVFSKSGFDGNLKYPIYFDKVTDSIRRRLYRLKDEQNIIPLIDSLYDNLTNESRIFLQSHPVTDDYKRIIEKDLLLSRFTAKMDYFTYRKDFTGGIQTIKDNFSLFRGDIANTIDYFGAIGSFQDIFSAKYHYNDPEKVLEEMKEYLSGDNYVYASLIFSNVLRQQLPGYNNPFTTSIAIEALEKTSDNDLIIFANYILNQEKVNEKANEILKNVKVKDYKGTTMTIGEVLNRKESKLKFVDLWASWCAPCVEAIPYTKELPFRFSSGTIQPFFISTDTDMEAWKNASKRLALLTEVSYVIADEASMKLLEEAVHLNAIPHYLLLDSENKIQVLRAPAAKSINQDFLSPFLSKNEETEATLGTPPPPPPPPIKKN